MILNLVKKNLECRVDRPNMIQDFFCENVFFCILQQFTQGEVNLECLFMIMNDCRFYSLFKKTQYWMD